MIISSNCALGARVGVQEPDQECEIPSPEIETLLAGVLPEKKLVIF
jgi:hypothetical protein